MQKKELADVIREARENKGISQRELARQIGVDNSSIAKIEKGHINKPTELVLKKIAKCLDIDIVELLKLADYDDNDIEFITSQTEKNIMSYFDDAPLYEVNQMIDYLEKELKATTNLRNAMVHSNLDNIDTMADLDNKEKKKLIEDWNYQVQEHNFKISNLEETITKLKDMFEKRKSNGETIVKLNKDITSIIEEYLNSIKSK